MAKVSRSDRHEDEKGLVGGQDGSHGFKRRCQRDPHQAQAQSRPTMIAPTATGVRSPGTKPRRRPWSGCRAKARSGRRRCRKCSSPGRGRWARLPLDERLVAHALDDKGEADESVDRRRDREIVVCENSRIVTDISRMLARVMRVRPTKLAREVSEVVPLTSAPMPSQQSSIARPS